MDPNYPREQESMDTEMLDAPSTGMVPDPGQPAKTPETRTAHGTRESAKEIPNTPVAGDPTKQSKVELRAAQEHQGNSSSIAPRNAEDSARSFRDQLERARKETRKLRDENRKLRDENQNLRDENQNLGKENQNLKQLSKCRETEANEVLCRENAKYTELYMSTTKQLEELRAEQEIARKTHLKTHLKLQAKEEELQKCKDELFDLQPPSQISDDQIGNEWERLCGNITRWIDDQAGGTGSVGSALGKLRQMDEFNDTVAQYWGSDRQELIQHASRYPYIIDVLIRYNIHCFLEERVFDQSVYMFGLGREDAELLNVIEEQMSALEPPRDRKTIDRWRSETLVAWSAIPNSQKSKFERAKELTVEADEFLTPLLPECTSDAFKMFYHDITLAAIELAGKMRRSTSAYHFTSLVDRGDHEMKWFTPPSFGKGGLVNISDFTRAEILDIDSNRNLKRDRVEKNADGWIGDRILTIYPALCRRGRDEDIVVSKELLLVKLSKPLPRRGKPREVESSWGKLGGIFDRVL